jgi:hypothetical protein
VPAVCVPVVCVPVVCVPVVSVCVVSDLSLWRTFSTLALIFSIAPAIVIVVCTSGVS